MSNSTSHPIRCACVQCTAQKLTNTSRAAIALKVASAALWELHTLLQDARTDAHRRYDVAFAANQRAREAGRIPADENLIAEELARQEANRAHIARNLIPFVGEVLEGSVDLDATAIVVSHEPRAAFDDRGGRRG